MVFLSGQCHTVPRANQEDPDFQQPKVYTCQLGCGCFCDQIYANFDDLDQINIDLFDSEMMVLYADSRIWDTSGFVTTRGCNTRGVLPSDENLSRSKLDKLFVVQQGAKDCLVWYIHAVYISFLQPCFSRLSYLCTFVEPSW